MSWKFNYNKFFIKNKTYIIFSLIFEGGKIKSFFFCSFAIIKICE